jgi:hypothetical protein
MGVGLWLGLHAVDFTRMRMVRAVLTLFGLIAGGTAIYWSSAYLLGAPELEELRRVAWRRRRP